MKAMSFNDSTQGTAKATFFETKIFDNLRGLFDIGKELQDDGYELTLSFDNDLDDVLYVYTKSDYPTKFDSSTLFLFKNTQAIKELYNRGFDNDTQLRNLTQDFVYTTFLFQCDIADDLRHARSLLDACYENESCPKLIWMNP